MVKSEITTKKAVELAINELIKEEEIKRDSYYHDYVKHLVTMKNTIKIEDEYIHKLVVMLQNEDSKLSIMRQVRYLLLEKL